MENCLVTKLKDVVNNDNLPKFGIIEMNISLSEDFSYISDVIGFSQDTPLKIIGEGHFINNQGQNIGKTYTFASSQYNYIKLSSGTYKIKVPKYHVTKLAFKQGIQVSLLDIYSLTSLLSFSSTSLNGLLETTKFNSDLTNLTISGNISGEVKDIGLDSLTSFTVWGLNNEGSLNVLDLATTNISNLVLKANLSTHTNITTCSMSEFISAIISKGKTSGSITLDLVTNYLYVVNYSSIEFKKVEWANNHVVIKDSSNNTIVEFDI